MKNYDFSEVSSHFPFGMKDSSQPLCVCLITRSLKQNNQFCHFALTFGAWEHTSHTYKHFNIQSMW